MNKISRFLISALFIILTVSTASAMSGTSVTVNPPGVVLPGKPVTVQFTIDATAFPMADELELYTDLQNPIWKYVIIVGG